VLSFAFNPDLYSYYTGRWFYDLIFYALIIVIMLNLIFGIIIDTFSSIRERETENHKDQISKCFICAYERGTIDQKIPEGFSIHVKKEHYMWNYIFYLVFLEKKGNFFIYYLCFIFKINIFL
jgi:inositol 1,4,5-triphosphate receptor type 3